MRSIASRMVMSRLRRFGRWSARSLRARGHAPPQIPSRRCAVPRAGVVGAQNDSTGALRGWSCRLQEVAQDVVADGGEDGLRVELHALDRIALVAHGHDDAAVGLRGDLELAAREALALDGQRVVADRLERARQAAKD